MQCAESTLISECKLSLKCSWECQSSKSAFISGAMSHHMASAAFPRRAISAARPMRRHTDPVSSSNSPVLKSPARRSAPALTAQCLDVFRHRDRLDALRIASNTMACMDGRAPFYAPAHLIWPVAGTLIHFEISISTTFLSTKSRTTPTADLGKVGRSERDLRIHSSRDKGLPSRAVAFKARSTSATIAFHG